MMDYFKKVGRPTDEEQALLNVIEQLIEKKQIARSEIPQCQSLDDLLEVQNLLEAYVSKAEQPTTDVTDENNDEAKTQENDIPLNKEVSEIPTAENSNETLNDLEQETTEVEQPQQLIEATETEQEPKEAVLGQPLFVADNDYDPFGDEIKERSYTNQSNQIDTPTNDSSTDDLHLDEAAETPVDNLNPNTKRKVAEQTANSILKGYAKLAPQPFKWMAKINENKIEKLAFEGQIDINLEVSEGTTFDEYMKQTNQQVDEIFEVDEDTLEEIKEPLIEVLLEQKLELTPQQRLMMAVVSHLFQMFTVALNLRRQNNRILEYQKRMTLLAAQKAA